MIQQVTHSTATARSPWIGIAIPAWLSSVGIAFGLGLMLANLALLMGMTV